MLDAKRTMCLTLAGSFPGLALPWPAVSEAVASYTAAVEAGAAPPPLPLYAEQQAAAAGGGSPAGGSFDVAFELLQLHAVAADPDSSGSAAAMQPLLARLLRCACGTLLACLRVCVYISLRLAALQPAPLWHFVQLPVWTSSHPNLLRWPGLNSTGGAPPPSAVQSLWADPRPTRLRLLLAPAGSAVCGWRTASLHGGPA